MAIPFTQYMRPDGHRVPQFIDLDATTEEKSANLIAQGFRFEIEVLTTGEVSMTIVHDDYGCDVAIRVCPNGPQVPAKVAEMINGFDPSSLNPPLPQADS